MAVTLQETSASRGPWKLTVVVCMGWWFAIYEDLNGLEFKRVFVRAHWFLSMYIEK